MHGYHWLEELHNAHYATLLRLAQNRLRAATGSTSEAEDVVQDVFLLAAQKDIRDVPNPPGWLIKTTCNLCRKRVDHIVREGEKKARFIQAKMDVSADRSVYSVEREDTPTELALWLMLMEQTLSQPEWELMHKYCVEGVPIEALAAEMGVPINRLKVKIHRIRKKFAKISQDT